MEQLQLFNDKDYRISLSEKQRDTSVINIVRRVKLGDKFFYSIKECSAILHCQTWVVRYLIRSYRIDAVAFGSSYRVPWYDLAAYILTDHEDTLQEDYDEYFKRKSA